MAIGLDFGNSSGTMYFVYLATAPESFLIPNSVLWKSFTATRFIIGVRVGWNGCTIEWDRATEEKPNYIPTRMHSGHPNAEFGHCSKSSFVEVAALCFRIFRSIDFSSSFPFHSMRQGNHWIMRSDRLNFNAIIESPGSW